MQFGPESISKIIHGEKTQTRRLVKPAHICDLDGFHIEPDDELHAVWTESSRGKITPVYTFRGDYAVQLGRGKPGVWWHPGRPEDGWLDESHPPIGAPLRIRITGIRREDVRNISNTGAWAEGFTDELEFWRVWCDLHDKTPVRLKWLPERLNHLSVVTNKYGISGLLMCRPAHLYTAWALTFEVVK